MATAKKSSTRGTAEKSSSGATKATGKKTTAKKTSRTAATDRSGSTTRRRGSAPQAEAPRRKGARQLAEEASRQLVEMTGKEPEGISGLRRSDDGWVVQVEVLELRRVPSTTDVLATYEVQVDSDGELQEYARVHRYVRGVPGEDGR